MLRLDDERYDVQPIGGSVAASVLDGDATPLVTWAASRPQPAIAPSREAGVPPPLTALARLMAADRIDLLHRAADTGAVTGLFAAGGDDGAAAAAMPLDDEPGFVPLGQAHWTARPDGGATAFVKLIESRRGTAWAAISFVEEPEVVRQRLRDTLPTFVTLLRSHATTLVALEDARTQTRAVVAALNQHDCGVFIVKRDHELLFANATAQRMLDARLGLQISRAKLRPLSYQDGVRFETALDCVIDAATAGRGKAKPAGMALLLEVAGHKRPMIVSMVPAGIAGPFAGSGKAAAIVYAMLPGWCSERGLEAICQIHGLSHVETELVRHLVAGMTIADAAIEMRVKADTARAYLKQVFAKTATNRQASLIRLVTRYQRAIRGDFTIHPA